MKQSYRRWQREGKPLPAPHRVKQLNLLQCQKKYGLNVLIATGTFLGEMISVMRHFFQELYSIELSPNLAAAAKQLFLKSPEVNIIEGDSSAILPTIEKQTEFAVLYWLDGHYSGEGTAMGTRVSPILEELEVIAKQGHRSSVIAIDDARLFDGTNDYPDLNSIREWAEQHLSHLSFQVKDDVILLLPEDQT